MIPAFEVNEAAAITNLAADLLLAQHRTTRSVTPALVYGRACGDMKANANVYIITNVIAAKLSNCFTQARATGAEVKPSSIASRKPSTPRRRRLWWRS